jgi:hypothetical protein
MRHRQTLKATEKEPGIARMAYPNKGTKKDIYDKSSMGRIAACCLVGGILCFFVFQLFIANKNSKVAMLYSDSYSQRNELQNTSLPTVARLIFAGGFFMLMLASLFFVVKSWHKVSMGLKVALVLMQVWMIIRAILAFSTGPQVSLSEICGTKGPLTWIACCIVFVGISPNGWQLARKLFVVLSNVAAVIVIAKMTLSGGISSTEQQAGRFFVGYIPLLIWTVPLLFYDPEATGASSLRTIWIMFPLLVLYISSILSGNRSWILMMVMHTAIIAFKYGKIILVRPRTSYVILLFMIISVWAASEVYGEKLRGVASFLSDTWYVDTRTDQYRQFLSQVSFTDLVIGKGPRATWIWNGLEYEWIDGQFTLLAFNGGLILLSTYIIIIVWPAFRLLYKRPSWRHAAPAIVLVFWTLAMIGLSTFTSVKVSYENAVICILAGRCYYLVGDRSNIQPQNFNRSVISHRNQYPMHRLV